MVPFLPIEASLHPPRAESSSLIPQTVKKKAIPLKSSDNASRLVD
jgi:hypothetical protein